MLRTSKVLAGVLLAVSATAIFPVVVWAGSSEHGHGAACHRELPTTPAPSEGDHQCCVSGHQWAVPGLPVVLRPVIAQVAIHQPSTSVAALLLGDHPLAFLSCSPPIETSLRI
ncbi:MAG TPA: hypothetical protein VMG82_04215 [Candidatus Sulfotelmatobacter sp.]|nr:hypothetical protein [Candidatus Sulfotelmatobacter sp.]